MAKLNMGYAWLVLAAITAQMILGCKRTVSAPGSDSNTRGVDANTYLCGICGQPITITLIATNYFFNPFFELNVTVKAKPQRELIHFLQDAAVKDPKFRFTAEHFGTLGYMITKINGVAASVSDKTYWQIIEHSSGNSMQLGVSTYVPMDNETVVFNFTTWDKTHA